MKVSDEFFNIKSMILIGKLKMEKEVWNIKVFVGLKYKLVVGKSV